MSDRSEATSKQSDLGSGEPQLSAGHRILGRENELIKWAVSPHRRAGVILLAVILIASTLECVGIAYLIPVLGVVIDGEIGGTWGEVLQPLLSTFSRGEMLVGLLLGFLAMILLKTAALFTRFYLSKRLVYRLRLHWMTRISGRTCMQIIHACWSRSSDSPCII